MHKSRSRTLREMQREQRFVKFHTRFEKSSDRGYVLDVGPRFFLLAAVNDGVRFDGFRCYRIADIRALMPDPAAAFAEAALRMRGERLPKKPRVDLRSLDKLLPSASRAFPLVTVHRNQAEPDLCHIGVVKRIHRGRLHLLEIDPNAAWEKEPCVYRLSEITRVGFGGGYEDALHLVGGEPCNTYRE